MEVYNLMSSKKLFGVVYANRRSFAMKTSATLPEDSKLKGKNSRIPCLDGLSWGPSCSMGARNFRPTLYNASIGQGWNQSMTVQFTKAGNFLARLRMASPTGLKHKDMCKFLRIRPMKYIHKFSGVSWMPAPLQPLRTPLRMASFSSLAYRSAMSPEAKRSLMKTRNFSLVIWPSVKRNSTPSSFTPALLYMACRSVLRSFMP
mmetsp:Transcript_146757/g.471077  ORF Transcript_146757/g.471077 Transcript_146757/m.471077 type:complete len:203 (-) Transcript_146757:7572-8180(-)